MTSSEVRSFGLCELKKHLESDTLTSREIVAALRESWEADEKGEKPLNAYVEFFDDAEDRAREADAARRAGETKPLLGLPVAVKDNISIQGKACACGSAMLKGYVAPYSATVIERLLAAGAILLGRTNMDEFAMGSSTEFSAYGPSRNPANRDLTPGGSSGGSAAAVAGFQAPAALGSETGGSVRLPASYCGIYGLKPTYGAVSRSGLVAFGSSLDQIGLFARSPDDLSLLFSVVAGGDSRDATSGFPAPTGEPATQDSPANPADPADVACSANLARLRVAVPAEFLAAPGLDPDMAAAVSRTADLLASRGAVVETISLPVLEASAACYYVIALSEAASNLSRYDGVRYGFRAEPGEGEPFDGFGALYAATRSLGFGDEVKRRVIIGNYVLSAHFSGDTYQKALAARDRTEREIAGAFATRDLILCPAAPAPAFPLGSRVADPLSMYLSDSFTAFANLARIPALSVPAGRNAGGLPLGVQLCGPRFGDRFLLSVARALAEAR